MISIIIPYYNRPEKILRCVHSILKQTYQDFEILVVDDHSTIPLILDNDPRITVFRNPKNLGPGISRNKGLENASGKYIAFLDSDDYWNPLFLEETIKKHILHPDIGMVYSNGENIDQHGLKSLHRGKFHNISNILPDIFFKGRPWGTGACVWKSETLKGALWVEYSNWEDYVFDTERALINNKILGISTKLIYYDTSGLDRLSQSNLTEAITAKSKGLKYISPILLGSEFRKNNELRKGIVLHIISNLNLFLYNDLEKNECVKSNVDLLKKWGYRNYMFIISIALRLNKRLGLRMLKHLKIQIHNS